MGVAERKAREKERKRNLILDCAENLFFTKGYKDTSIDDIAQCAEYSKGTIYLYFTSKDEIYLHIMLRAINIMYSMFREYAGKQKTGLDKIEYIGRAHFDFLNKYPNYYNIMKMFGSLELDFEQVGDILQQIGMVETMIDTLMINSIKLGQEDGTMRTDLPAETISMLLKSMSSGVFDYIDRCDKMGGRYLGNANSSDLFEAFFLITGTGVRP